METKNLPGEYYETLTGIDEGSVSGIDDIFFDRTQHKSLQSKWFWAGSIFYTIEDGKPVAYVSNTIDNYKISEISDLIKSMQELGIGTDAEDDMRFGQDVYHSLRDLTLEDLEIVKKSHYRLELDNLDLIKDQNDEIYYFDVNIKDSQNSLNETQQRLVEHLVGNGVYADVIDHLRTEGINNLRVYLQKPELKENEVAWRAMAISPYDKDKGLVSIVGDDEFVPPGNTYINVSK